MKIATTYTTTPSGAGKVVAKGIGGKQKSTRWDSSKSTDWNHGTAAANLILHVQATSPELQYGDNLPLYVCNSLDAGHGTHIASDDGVRHHFDV